MENILLQLDEHVKKIAHLVSNLQETIGDIPISKKAWMPSQNLKIV